VKHVFLAAFLIIVGQLAAQQPKPGGSVSGIVLDVSSDRPIGDVQVSLYDPSVPSGNSPGTITNGQGEFAFTGLPTGRYLVSIKKQGFALARPSDLKLPSAYEVWVSVKDRESQMLELKLVPTGVITGRVMDTASQPVRSAVWLGIHGFDENGNDTIRIVSDSNGMVADPTNDRGEYRRFGLERGKYVVVVSSSSLFGGFPTSASKIPLTYFPGTTDASKAVFIDVAPGQEVDLGEIAIQPFMGSRVTLHFMDSISPGSRTLSYRPMFGVPIQYSLSATPDLVMPSMPPGYYDFFIQDVDDDGTEPTHGRPFARVELTLNGSDVDKTVFISQGFHVHGTVQSEDLEGRRVPVTGLTVRLKPTREGRQYSMTVQKNGSWDLEHAAPGRYNVEISNLPSGSYLGSAVAANKDVLDGIEITSDTTMDMVVRAGGGSIEGGVFDSAQHPISSAVVVLLPDPQSPRQPHLIRQIVSDIRGAFHFDGLAPGAYRAYAWRELESNAYLNSKFMEPYIERGTPLRVTRDDKTQVLVTVFEE